MVLSIDEELEDSFINLYEHYTPEHQREFVRRLQKIAWKQQGNR